MQDVHAHKVGLVIGGVFAVMHALWALAVLLGVAKPFLDFVIGLHFMSFQYDIIPFSFGNALLLIVVTGVVGYVIGLVAGTLWNKVHGASHGA